MIYLDNSATTYIKPKEVIKAVNDALLYYSANPGRSGHQASIKTAFKIEEARECVARHFNAESVQNVIWTQNCSQALNLAILGSAKQGGHIIATENEHNSVLRPLEHLKCQGIIDYSIASQADSKGITLDDIKKHVKPNTYMIICNHISNVNGAKAEIKEIGQFCKEHGYIFLVDGAQSCGHLKIDIKENNIDYLSVAGHKGFYAPQSIGCLVMNDTFRPQPITFGGTGTNSLELVQPDIYPERLESGTISTPLILGLSAGIHFVENNFKEINGKIDDLATYLIYELTKLDIPLYTHPENPYGVVSFNIKNIDSNEVANILNSKYGICVRGGYHCAPLKHKALGTLEQGAVRVSLSYFNNFTEIQKLLYAIKHIAKQKASMQLL
ncbi:MAG: aminotransferase class V-fold PLP-dependent enzyme [Clostridia bacterium]|nr:aminotransferase class V-fold PLP-dependent enzyme [Clostridia bacterium]